MPDNTDNDSRPPHEPLLTLRAALILLVSVLAAVGAGFLTTQAGRGLAEAILAGCRRFRRRREVHRLVDQVTEVEGRRWGVPVALS